jgi:hypothetical protein
MPEYVLAVGMNERMRRLVSQGADILELPSDQDFVIKATSLLLRSMGLAPTRGRPLGYSQRRATAAKKKPAVRAKARR